MAGRRAARVAALVMRRRTVWLRNALASSPLAMMRILPWSMRSRPNGGPAQPTSIWPDITCVKVDAGLPVATGSPASTLTQVMSGQIDVGWAGPPFGLDLIDQGKIRIIASGNDASAFKNQTVRLLIANAATLQARRPAIERFMAAYRETVDWMYSDPAVFKHYSDFLGVSEATGRRGRDGFYPKAALDPDTIVGVDAINADAVAFKYMAAPLTKQQLAELIHIPPR